MVTTTTTVANAGDADAIPNAATTEDFEVLLVSDDRDPGYAVFCPSLPGCGSQGDTRAEALEMIADAIAGFVPYYTRPRAPQSRKTQMIAEYTADGCRVETATVRVSY